jgi:hypothetical protein
MAKRKFKILYPMDDSYGDKRGKPFIVQGKDMLVMNNRGIFFIFGTDGHNAGLRKLSDVLPKYDVVWCDK